MNASENGSKFDDRAVRALAAPQHWLMSALLLLPASYATLAWAWNGVSLYWTTALLSASRWVGIPIEMADVDRQGAWLATPELQLHWSAQYPGDVLLLVTALVSIAAFSASFVRKERWLPVAYLVRVLAAVQLGVCGYFLASPSNFPYTAQEHLRAIFLMQTMIVKDIPLAMSLIYYPLDFTLTQKAAATLLITVYFIAILPFVLTLHTCIVFHASLLFVPLCFFLLGAPLMLGLFLTLYSYCASWPGVIRQISKF